MIHGLKLEHICMSDMKPGWTGLNVHINLLLMEPEMVFLLSLTCPISLLTVCTSGFSSVCLSLCPLIRSALLGLSAQLDVL